MEVVALEIEGGGGEGRRLVRSGVMNVNTT